MSTGVPDPAARARWLVGEVQALGLSSAAAVAERYVDTLDRYLARRAGPPGAPAGPPGDTPAEAVDQLARAWARSLDLVASALDHTPTDGGTACADPLVLPAARPDSVSDASVWVHNPTASEAGVVVRVGVLTAAEGHTLPAGAVTVEPVEGCTVAAGRSAEVRVLVRVPPSAAPGHYHGLLLTPEAPERPLPVRLEVLPAERTG